MITRTKALKLRALIEKACISLSDEDALEGVELFPAWQSEHDYSVGDRTKYHDILYKCIQAHTSQASWHPDITPALWMIVSVDEWPEWIQPKGSEDAYMTDDKVSHNNKHWISVADYNIWEPGVYGWEEVT